MKLSFELVKILIGALLYAAAHIFEGTVGTVCAVAAIVICGYGILIRAIKDIAHGKIFSVSFLMVLSATVAAAMGEAEEGAAVVLFYCIGEYLEDKADEKSEEKLREYMHKDAESPDEEKTSAPAERFMEKFARVYTPAVVVLALGVSFLPPLFGAEGALFSWIKRGLMLLVISCPCAIAASVPIAFSLSRSTLARGGVFVSGGAVLQKLSKAVGVRFENTEDAEKNEKALSSLGVSANGGDALVRAGENGSRVLECLASGSPDAVMTGPEKTARLLKQSRKTMRIVYENLILFAAVKGTVIVLSIIGVTAHMWLAVLSDVGLLAICLLNSFRLFFQSKSK